MKEKYKSERKNIDQNNAIKYHRPLPNSPAILFTSLCNMTEQLFFKELYMHILVPEMTKFQEHLNMICKQTGIDEYHTTGDVDNLLVPVLHLELMVNLLHQKVWISLLGGETELTSF